VIILIALVPWIFILMRYIGVNEASEQNPGIGENPVQTPSPMHSPDLVPERTPMPAPEPTPRRTPEPTPEPEPDERLIDINYENPELTEILDNISSQSNCASVSLVVYDGGKKEYFSYLYGYADVGAKRSLNADTKFRVASLSKLVTVICAMVLVDKQVLDLDMDISYYLGYDAINPDFPNTAITVRMLMQHTSSFYDSDDFQNAAQGDFTNPVRHLIEADTSYKNYQPGTQYEYSNFGFSILAAVCEIIYGKKFDTLAREVLFEPMGIDAAYVASRLSDTSNIAAIYNERHTIRRSVQSLLNTTDSGVLGADIHLAQGNLTISAVDYARILAMLGNNGVFEGERILSQQSVREINYPTRRTEFFELGLSTRRSELLFMPGRTAYWHTGSAYGAFAQYVYSVDATNRGIVVVTTGAVNDRLPNGMIRVCTELAEAAWKNLENGG